MLAYAGPMVGGSCCWGAWVADGVCAADGAGREGSGRESEEVFANVSVVAMSIYPSLPHNLPLWHRYVSPYATMYISPDLRTAG